MRRIAVAVVCLAALFAANANARAASYRDVECLFENDFSTPERAAEIGEKAAAHFRPAEGVDGSGALFFHTPDNKKTDWIVFPLDPARFQGRLLRLKATVKAEGIGPGSRAYAGSKIMLHYKNPQRNQHPQTPSIPGSRDWHETSAIIPVPGDLELFEVHLGLQNVAGRFWVDRVSIHAVEESPDDDLPPPAEPDPEALAIPRGGHRGAKFRGVMSGRDLSDEAIAELNRWGANLIRFQLVPARGTDIGTPEKYLAWLDTKMDEADVLLERCAPYDIRVVLDLHRAPGGGVTAYSSNILDANTSLDTLEEAWRRLAGRFKGHPLIYGYDLLNEPTGKAQHLAGGGWPRIAERLARAIRAVDADTPLIIEPHTGNESFAGFERPKVEGPVIFSPHMYQPMAYTHQGVYGTWLKYSYPGWIDGVYWDKERLRLALRSAIEFQREHDVPMYVGEFGVATWAKGGERWLSDAMELFEEYGWDWTYHAYREWGGWSVEHESDEARKYRPSPDNPRKRVLLEALGKNRAAP